MKSLAQDDMAYVESLLDDLLKSPYNVQNSNPSAISSEIQAPIKTKYENSGDFSYNPSPRHANHMGVDMRAAGGTPVYPMMAGTVTFVGSDGKGGNVINIQHANNLRTYYAHLGTIKTHQGEQVDNNTVIGTVGDSGNARGTFPHLHFQVWKDNQIQNPATFFYMPKYSLPAKGTMNWLSDSHKQDAKSFDVKKHVSTSRQSIAKQIHVIEKMANTYLLLTKKL